MNDNKFSELYFSRVTKVCYLNFFSNLVLMLIKLFGGIFGNSSALITDSVESGGACLTSGAYSLSLKLAKKDSDENHQYGYEKIENILSLVISIILIFSAGILAYNSILILINKTYV